MSKTGWLRKVVYRLFHSFTVARPSAWNSLPTHISNIHTHLSTPENLFV